MYFWILWFNNPSKGYEANTVTQLGLSLVVSEHTWVLHAYGAQRLGLSSYDLIILGNRIFLGV